MKTRLRADGLQRSLHVTPVSLGRWGGWCLGRALISVLGSQEGKD